MYGFRKGRALVAIPGPGSRGRAYGFVDEEGVEVIPPHFESADIAGFADGSGLARVGDGGKVGLIDLDGKIVVGPRYDYIGKFVDGFAVVGVGGHFGLINVAGHETIAPRYQSLGFWVSASEVLEGPMAGSRDVLLVAASNRLAGVVDATGAVRVPLEWDEIPSEPYLSYAYVQHTGLLWVRRGSKYGLLNRNGKVITQPVYDAVRIDHEMWDDSGFAVSIAGKWGLVNRHGRLSVPIQYDWIASRDVAGIIPVRSGRLFGAVNADGETIVPTSYDSVEPYPTGFIRVGRRGRFGFARANGNTITGLIYEDGGPFVEGVAPVRRAGKWGLINALGTELIAPIYDRLDVAGFKPNHIRFRAIRGKRCTYFDKNGIALTSSDYDAFREVSTAAPEWMFRHERACVARAGRYGFVDDDGAEVVELKYDAPATYVEQDFAFVRLGGRGGFIDANGREFFDDFGAPAESR